MTPARHFPDDVGRFPLGFRFRHWFIQRVLRRKPTCSFCSLSCEPIYDGRPCEICDEYDWVAQRPEPRRA